jgi:parallel beta-helix repeat protein
MAIVYCDWATGNDTTGDGTYSLPYQTITKASTGLTGGDEVRVGKSPDNQTLTGTVTFTAGSTAVTGSGTAFTTELVIGDFLVDSKGDIYEVITLTDNTAAVLYQKYPSTTESGTALVRAGVTSTGEAAAASTSIQTVSASGTSVSSRLTLSGGWDLATQTVTGTTRFKQVHSTFSIRNGRALNLTTKSYLHFENLGFLRYYTGIYLSTASTYNTFTSCVANSSTYYGIYLYTTSTYNTFTSCVANSSANYGIYLYPTSTYNTFTSCVANSSANIGICLSSNNTLTSCTANYSPYGFTTTAASGNNTLTSCTANSNSYGFSLATTSGNNTLTSCTANSNSTTGFVISGSNNTLTSCTANSNSYGFSLATGASNNPLTSCVANSNTTCGISSDLGCRGVLSDCLIGGTEFQFALSAELTGAAFYSNKHDQTLDNDWVFYAGGTANKQTTTTQSGSGFAWKLLTSSITRTSVCPLPLSVAKIACAANSEVTVTAYVKKDHATNCGARLRLKGHGVDNVTDTVVTKANDTDWQQLTLTFTPHEIGVVEILFEAWYVAGHAAAYIDTLAVSQA